MTVSAHDSDDGPGAIGGAQGGYVVGVDFGTLSGRAVVVRVSDGAEVGTDRRHEPLRLADRR